MRRVALASFVGALLEWYDFYIFAAASALVFGRLFFPGGDRVVSVMESFGALGLGFLARPVGGVLFGYIGDRVGRKAGLVATLLITGLGTFLIGLLPTHGTVGLAAPALLVGLRILQGVGLGGEYGSATLLAIEHAPPRHRGFWGSLPQAASPGGLLLATGVFGLVAALPQPAFFAWGWRVPFLLSAVMLGVGLFIRLGVSETPAFLAAHPPPGHEEAPLLGLLRQHKCTTLLAIGARLGETVSGNLVKSFALSYVIEHLHLARAVPLQALTASAVFGLLATPFYGWLSDRVGQKALYVAGSLFAAGLAFPFFWLLQAGTAPAVWLAFVLLYTLAPTLMLSVQATLFAGMFSTRTRCTGLSVAYQISAVVGGFTPLAAEALFSATGGASWGPAGMLTVLALLSAACAFAARPSAS